MRAEADEELQSALREKDDAEASAVRIGGELLSVQESREQADKHVAQVLLAQSKRFAARCVAGLGMLLVAAVLAAAIATPLVRNSGAVWTGVSIGAGAIVVVLTVLQALYGSSQVSLAVLLRTRIADWRYERLRRPFVGIEMRG